MEHRFAQLTVFATFLLLLIGGTVNPTGSSLACPEPTFVCHGQLFPEMTGGVLYEHGHRLVAMTVGFLQIILTLLLWRRRPSLKWLGVGALVMVCTQGALGALTVKYKLPTAVSTGHLMLAFLYLATLIYLAWKTRKEPARRPAGDEPLSLGKTRTLVGIACVVVYMQVVLGGLVRHLGASLACLDLPFCNGSIMPADAPLPLIIHMTHRIGAVLVALTVISVSIAVFRKARGWRAMRGMAIAAPVLVGCQIGLGVATILTLRETPVAVAHFGGAALLWGLWVSMWLVSGGSEPAPARVAARAGEPATSSLAAEPVTGGATV